MSQPAGLMTHYPRPLDRPARDRSATDCPVWAPPASSQVLTERRPPNTAELCARPSVANVRSPFLVVTIGDLYRNETVALVELSRLHVALEGPEVQARRMPRLGDRNELGSESTPRPVGVDVQLIDPIIVEDQEPDDPPSHLDDPDLSVRQHDGPRHLDADG
jgi:hypothetical protein